MEQRNTLHDRVKEVEVVSGIKVIQTEYSVKVPVFEEVIVERPVFKDKQIEIPAGFDRVINAISLELADKITANVLAKVDDLLQKAIQDRLTSITYPKLIEEVKVNYIPVSVEKPIFKDVEVERPIFIDKPIINPIPKDVEVTNAVIIDRPVINAMIEDVRVTNAIIKDVEVERAVVREKVVEVIHKTCLDSKGNRLSE